MKFFFYSEISIILCYTNTRVKKMKKGFVSMATVYIFLIVFLLILSSILSKYVVRNRLINSLSDTVKTELNERYYNE